MWGKTTRSCVLFACLASVTCGGTKKPQPGAGTTTPGTPGKVARLLPRDEPGLDLRLTEALGSGAAYDKVPAAKAEMLDAARVKALLGRLEPLGAAEQTSFAFRKRSLPPPRTGDTVGGAFPPPVVVPAPEVASGPLTVLRSSPEGNVPLAPHVSVTFSRPMVAVSSQAETQKTVPVTLAPDVPGTWRWVGTRTILFEPSGDLHGGGRFPMATRYEVTVPAGTKAADGSALQKAASFSFQTPPPRLLGGSPSEGPVRLDPVVFASFDQKIDPEAVLGKLRLQAGSRTVAARLATAEEIAADDRARDLVQGSTEGRWLAFVPETPLPPDTVIDVAFPAGLPSAEGPLSTTKTQSFDFKTYGRFQVTGHECGYGSQCPPMTPFRITLSNPVDATQFEKDMVTVTPAIDGMKVNVHHDTLYVTGRTKGRTTYKVALSPALPDRFGQTLGGSKTMTFETDDARPQFMTQGGPVVVLDPAAGARYSVYTINHDALRVRAWRVGPDDWRAYTRYLRDFRRDDRKNTPPGKKVLDTRVPVKGPTDELVETAIDLRGALGGDHGQLVVLAEPAKQPADRWQRAYAQAWVQATGIGLTAFEDGQDLYAWATDLSTGAPIAGADVRLLPTGESAKTDATGMAKLPLGEAAHMLVATSGKDTAVLPDTSSMWSDRGNWTKRNHGVRQVWYVADDRNMYRPGETVTVKGWIRRLPYGPGEDVEAPGELEQITWQLLDSRGNEIEKGGARLSAASGFDFTVKLPDTVNLGHTRLRLGAAGGATEHVFQVQEFRRPEYEVTTEATGAPHVVGQTAEVGVTAAYYAGGALGGADVAWRVTSQPGTFVPPGRDEYTFGFWTPWWGWARHGGGFLHDRSDQETRVLAGRTSATGKHHVELAFVAASPPRPMSVSAQATVTDVNRQAWASTAHLLVHPGAAYVGLRSDRYFVEAGKPLELEAIVVDLDGKALAGNEVVVTAVRLEHEQVKGEWEQVEKDAQQCRFQAQGDRPAKCTFQPKEGGQHRITARVTDSQGRASETQITRWVSGGKQPPAREVEEERLVLIPGKQEYAAGDTAEILVMAPWPGGEGVLVVGRQGILSEERFSIDGTSHTLRVPLTDAMTPGVQIRVDVVGAAPRTADDGAELPGAPKRPAFASGSLTLRVPPVRRTLSVKLQPKHDALAPGQSTPLGITVLDADRKPVAGAEVAVFVVDEAILALSSYEHPDPVAVFYPERPLGVSAQHLRELVLLSRPDDIEGQTDSMEAPMEESAPEGVGAGSVRMQRKAAAAPMASMEADMDDGGGDAAPIRVRSDFNPLAHFTAAATTDASGRARVNIALPDNLTRYRIVALAAADTRLFGKGETALLARMPLMVRPSPPRFLNFGDRFQLPVVVQNQTDEAMTVEMAVRASNVNLTAGQGRRFEVPANDRVEVQFPASSEMAGKALFQVVAVTTGATDAARFELPVWTPATTEAFATYGTIDDGAIAQPVKAPPDVVPQFGGLEVSVASTALHELTDAVIYLVTYPFECSEQIASRMMGIAALKDVLAAFDAEDLPSAEKLKASVTEDLRILGMIQNHDGGFPFWRRGDRSWPYLTVHVAHALGLAKKKGYEGAGELLSKVLPYLARIESHIPSAYPPKVRWAIMAYALFTRDVLGDRQPGEAAKLLARAGGVDKVSLETLGWLMPVLGNAQSDWTQKIRRHLDNRVTETAATAQFDASYSDADYLLLHSSRRTDAIILAALIREVPKHDLVPKLVRGLLAHRTRGRWLNTQENAFVLLALDRYFQTFEKATPSFVARVWLGDQYAGEEAFKGRSTDRFQIDVPMQVVNELAGAKPAPLVVQKNGKGRLYYRIGMKYAPESLSVEAADFGFTVQRLYEAVDDPGDVKRAPDGSWRIKAGARVRVRLTMVAPARRYHVALVDPLPAGLEPMNPALAVTGDIPEDPDASEAGDRPGWWWWRPWFEHQNMRDERVEAFTSLLWEGVHEYTYVARATTPGQFVVPPTKAEEMYHPETFGRSATDRVTVE